MSRPVFIDLETCSTCDLKVAGGRVYAKDPTTALVTVSWSPEPEEYHVWFPTLGPGGRADWQTVEDQKDVQLPGIHVHYGRECPVALVGVADRIWVAHNAWTFDQHVWEATGYPHPAEWLDTFPLALAAGLPGGLDKIGHRLWGEGKYEAGNQTAKKVMREDGRAVLNVTPVSLIQVGRYNVQDVRLLAWLWEELRGTLRLTPEEKETLRTHRAVNSRGVRVDVPLLRSLVVLLSESKTDALGQIKTLLGGDVGWKAGGTDEEVEKWLRSGDRVKVWLKKCGFDIGDSLARNVVSNFLVSIQGDGETDDEDDPDGVDDSEAVLTSKQENNVFRVVQLLSLRMACLRVTAGKLTAAISALGDNTRLYDLLVYYAAHTGRWSGRRVNIHNLPRPKEGIDYWAALRSHESPTGLTIHEARKAIDPNAKVFLTADDVASACLRSFLLPDEGEVILAADYANIEGRVLAWLAEEGWLLDAFRRGDDPYLLTAAKVYGKKPEDWPGVREGTVKVKKHPWRQVGKVVELGCLAEGTPILTDRGWVSIEAVTLDDRVWDGQQWCSHFGVVYKGKKPCVNRGGVWLTTDHEILTADGWEAAGDLTHIPSLSGTYSEGGQFWLSESEDGVPLNRLTQNAPADRWPTLQSVTSWLDGQLGVIPVRKPNPPGPTNGMLMSCLTAGTGSGFSPGYRRYSADAGENETTKGCVSIRSGLQIGGRSYGTYSPSPAGILPTSRSIVLTDRKGTSRVTSVSRLGLSKTTIAARTYDILNAGPNSRFQAGGLIVHNCGYQLGSIKFASYSAGMGIDLKAAGVTADQCINAYRDSHVAIAGRKVERVGKPSYRVGGFWNTLNDAALRAGEWAEEVTVGRLGFRRYKGHLYLRLPSGRELIYRNVRVEEVMPKWANGDKTKRRKALLYASPRWHTTYLYGGKLAENVVQAASRDVLAAAVNRCEAAGLKPIFHVHDEPVCSGPASRFEDYMRAVTTLPVWADGLPLDAEGGILPRYAKSPPPGVKEYMWRDGRPL